MYNFILSVLCSQLIYFVLTCTKRANFLGNQIGKSGVLIGKRIENSSPSCVQALRKTLNLVISRCCFADDGEEVARNVPKS